MPQTKQKETRGGKRPGAGRPPGKQPLSVKQVQELERKAKAYAKKFGKTVDEIILDFVYGSAPVFAEDADGNIEHQKPQKIPPQQRLAAAKLFKDFASIKPGEGGEADKQLGPRIYLPEHKAPDNVTPIGEKNA